jgi:hypothetical protein
MKLTANNTLRMPLQSTDMFVKRVPYKGRTVRTDFSMGHRFNKKPSVTIVYRPDEWLVDAYPREQRALYLSIYPFIHYKTVSPREKDKFPVRVMRVVVIL